NQNPCLDLTGGGRKLRPEATMKRNDSAQRSAVARELERKRSAHAIANHREAARIDLRQRGESVKGDTRPAADVHRFFHQCGGQLDRFWQIIELDSIAIRVGAQCYVAQLREPLRAALGILTE